LPHFPGGNCTRFTVQTWIVALPARALKDRVSYGARRIGFKQNLSYEAKTTRAGDANHQSPGLTHFEQISGLTNHFGAQKIRLERIAPALGRCCQLVHTIQMDRRDCLILGNGANAGSHLI
jgi:hypothetical protein